MDLNLTQIIIGVLAFVSTTASGVLGWFAKTLWSAVQELKTDLAKLREELPKTYIQKNDFSEFRHEFREVTNKILDRLDRKVDK